MNWRDLASGSGIIRSIFSKNLVLSRFLAMRRPRYMPMSGRLLYFNWVMMRAKGVWGWYFMNAVARTMGALPQKTRSMGLPSAAL